MMQHIRQLPVEQHIKGHQKNRTYEDKAILIIDETGKIQESNGSAAKLFGSHHENLAGKQISDLIPQLAELNFFQRGHINPRLSLLSRMNWSFNAQDEKGKSFRCRLYVSHVDNDDSNQLRIIIRKQVS